ncbi:MAG: cell wall hydrolase [Christensenellaceae bacterium]|nr:cell wall hydrolase [Christensenellaceae bacterium]
MKKRILKLLTVTGLYLVTLFSAAGLAAVAAPAELEISAEPDIPAEPDALSMLAVGAVPAAKPNDHSARRWTEWLSDEFAVKPSGTPAKTPLTELAKQLSAPAHIYTEQEKAYIARVVYAEARGEPFEGKVAVAAVVLNRFESGRFGRTVKKVVFARNQFAVSRRYNAECMAAVNAAIDQRDAFPDDMYYFQVSKSKRWRNFKYYTRIGHHSFYCA